MLINNNIPDISKQIYEKDLLNILEKKYSILVQYGLPVRWNG